MIIAVILFTLHAADQNPGLFRRVTTHDCPEIIRIEAGAANKSAVDLGESEDGRAVSRVHLLTLAYADAGWFATPDSGIYPGVVVGGRGPARSDRTAGLIGD